MDYNNTLLGYFDPFLKDRIFTASYRSSFNQVIKQLENYQYYNILHENNYYYVKSHRQQLTDKQDTQSILINMIHLADENILIKIGDRLYQPDRGNYGGRRHRRPDFVNDHHDKYIYSNINDMHHYRITVWLGFLINDQKTCFIKPSKIKSFKEDKFALLTRFDLL
jgi:hypothetical protein